MTPQERDLVSGLFERLKNADVAQKDREAEDLIGRLVVQQPAASYLLVQTVLVQEHALNNAQARIAQLEAELAAAKHGQPEAAGKGSFLGGLAERGPWGARMSASPPPPATVAQAAAQSPPPAAGGPMPAAPAGGGFLHQALATAAGVAGGALLFDGIRSLFYHNPGPFGPALGTGWGQPMGGPTEATIINNYYGNNDGNDASGGDPNTGDASGAVDTGYTPDDLAQPTDQGSLQDADLGGDASDFGGDDGADFSGGDGSTSV